MKIRKAYLKSQNSPADLPLLLAVIALCLFGLVMVYDGSVVHAYQDFGDNYYYARQQLIWLVLGTIGTFFLANFDYQKLKKMSFVMLVISIGLLLAVFIPGLGAEVSGASRWLSIGPITVQPAEIVKLTSIIWLAAILEKGPRLKPLLGILFIVGFITAFLQKDLGSTIIFVISAASLFLVSGGAIWQIGTTVILSALAGSILIFTSAYRRSRLTSFLDPFGDPQGLSYHISQVLLALGSGGLFGLGLGQSRQKFYIPEVTTDSIFAVVGEELGFIGGLVLISLFALLIIRGFRIAEKAPDQFGKLLAVGLISWLGAQSIINLSAMVAFLPLTGVPLPFISYGGSALVANLAAVGILLNISKKS